MYYETDAPAVINGGGNGGCGFGNSEGWWIIILFALIFGWNRGGYGGYGNGSDGVMNNYVLGSDFGMISRQLSDGFSGLERKGDSIQNGLCDGFYAQNTNLLNGFSGVQQTLCQGFSGINTAIVQQGYETRLGIGDVKTQIGNCCCNLEGRLSDINYNMSMNTNALQNTMCLNTRDIIENQNANYRAIHDELVANKLEAKNDIIAQQQAEIGRLQLRASQEEQNNFLLKQLKPQPYPAYVVPNPNCCYGNNGCGCGGTTAL